MTTPQLYLLPCPCGEKLRVRTRQAGEAVTCSCGAVHQVPTIRGLKKLETVDDAEAVTAPPSPLLAGPLFAIGLLALFAGCVFLAVTVLWPSPVLKMDVNLAGMTPLDAERSQIAVDELGPDLLYDEFLFLRDRARGDHAKYAQSVFDAALISQKASFILGGVVSGVGALLVIAGLAMPLLTSGGPRKD